MCARCARASFRSVAFRYATRGLFERVEPRDDGVPVAGANRDDGVLPRFALPFTNSGGVPTPPPTWLSRFIFESTGELVRPFEAASACTLRQTSRAPERRAPDTSIDRQGPGCMSASGQPGVPHLRLSFRSSHPRCLLEAFSTAGPGMTSAQRVRRPWMHRLLTRPEPLRLLTNHKLRDRFGLGVGANFAERRSGAAASPRARSRRTSRSGIRHRSLPQKY